MQTIGLHPDRIYILLSIKTRIETLALLGGQNNPPEFISYYPLKQGLKPHDFILWVVPDL